MAITFKWGSTSISITLILYSLFSLCTGLYLVQFAYSQNKPISAMIILVLLILVFIFFGRRWFQYGQLKGSQAWVTANALALSESTTKTSSGSPGSLAELCAAAEDGTIPSVWPPVINHCPDFMTMDNTRKCVDTQKLYGTTEIGQTFIPPYSGNSNVCGYLSEPTKSQYLRWEGVVQTEGGCSPKNIGKSPSV